MAFYQDTFLLPGKSQHDVVIKKVNSKRSADLLFTDHPCFILERKRNPFVNGQIMQGERGGVELFYCQNSDCHHACSLPLFKHMFS
jgi:hypothetical protein